MVDPDLEEKGCWIVIINWRACLFKKGITLEEHACEEREIFIDDQVSLSTVLLFQFYSVKIK